MRRGLVIHRGMDGRAAVLRDELGGSFGEGEVCGVLPVRRVVGQPGLAGCVSCTDIPCVQLEWEGFACGPWGAFAGARGKAAWVQEREVFAQADVCGFDETCGRRERLSGACVRIFVVRRDLNCSAHDFNRQRRRGAYAFPLAGAPASLARAVATISKNLRAVSTISSGLLDFRTSVCTSSPPMPRAAAPASMNSAAVERLTPPVGTSGT